MAEGAALGVFCIAEQGRGGGMRLAQGLRAEGRQRCYLQLRQQPAHAQRRVKLPGGARGECGATSRTALSQRFEARFKSRCHVHVVDHLAGRDTRHPGFDFFAGALRQMDLALRHAQPGQAAGVAASLVQGQQNRFGFVRQQFGVGQRARRDHAHHLALDRPLACGLAHLLANGHRLTELDQLGQVAFD